MTLTDKDREHIREDMARVLTPTHTVHALTPEDLRPPPLLSTRTRVTWTVVLSLLGVAAVGAAALARAQDAGVRVEAHEAKIQKLEVDAAENRSEHRAMREVLQQIRDDLKEIKADLKGRR